MEEITKPTQTVMIDPNEPLILPDGTALTGRIEWFLYSLCLLDYEHLPTPMSRIEEFANALVTGEVPNIEPQSRVEEYFLAILTGDVENLPEPESRVEVLLNKLARGEFDLSDVEPIQSRYELLIAYLIKNSGIGDITYVLHEFLASETPYTMYNTQEKPTKSAILKGQTLVNYFNPNTISELPDEGFLLNEPDFSRQRVFNYIPLIPYEENTEYTTFVWLKDVVNPNNVPLLISIGGTDLLITNFKNGINMVKGTTRTISSFYNIRIGDIDVKNGAGATLMGAVILKGDYTTILLNSPFYGMQSVKMPVLTTTGKNLFNPLNFKNGELVEINGEKFFKYVDGAKPFEFTTDFETNKQYTITFSAKRDTGDETKDIYLYVNYTDGSRDYRIINGSGVDVGTITTSVNKTISKICGSNGFSKNVYINLNVSQLEEGSIATSYEPYKTNILTTTSKNLFNMNRPYDNLTDSQATVVQDTNQITVSSSAESGIYVNANFILDKDFFAGKTVTGSCLYESDENDIGTVQITYQDGNGEHHYQWIKTPKTFTFPNSFIGDVMLSVSANNTGTPQSNTVTVKNIQLELGSTATPYEPYSEVTLRGIGDVKDTLDSSGELTQRIGEVVLDGSSDEDWYITYGGSDTHTRFVMRRGSNLKPIHYVNQKAFLCSKFKCVRLISGTNSDEMCLMEASDNFFVSIIIDNTKLNSVDVDGFKLWLQSNPVKFNYVIEDESIKTVDLSILDQDGATVEKLNTFKDITHVSCSVDEGSIYPYVEMEVATSNDEDLAAIGLKLEEKNKVQSKLIKVNDYQSDVIDNVMLGITEIYESI